MYKSLNNLVQVLYFVICLGFAMPLLGLFPGRRGTESLFKYDLAMYAKTSYIGGLAALIAMIFCIAVKNKIKKMDSEIKLLYTNTTSVLKYNWYRGRCFVTFELAGKKYKKCFEGVKVRHARGSSGQSFVCYKIYKNEVIPVGFTIFEKR